jgi:hypothetical protein
MSSARRSFVVTVFEDGRVAVVEDVQTGEHARVDDLDRVGAQIAAWAAAPAAVHAGAGGATPGARADSRPGH